MPGLCHYLFIGTVIDQLPICMQAAGNPASVRDANAAAHNAQRQQTQQNIGAQAPPIATQVIQSIYLKIRDRS